MDVQINIDNYPEIKKEILDELEKKCIKKDREFKPEEVTFVASFGVRIGPGGAEYGEKNPCSIIGKYGRLEHYVQSSEIDEVNDYFKNMDKNKKEEEKLESDKEGFLSSVLLKVGKKSNFGVNDANPTPAAGNLADLMGSMMKHQQVIYPTLDDLKKAFRSVYLQYQIYANGKNLVYFAPENKKSDKYGFIKHQVKVVYEKENKLHILCESSDGGTNLNNFFVPADNPGEVVWIYQQNQREFDKALKADVGEFVHNKVKCKKLSNEEIDKRLKGHVFEDGGADITRSMKPGVNNFGGGLVGFGF